MRALRWRAAFTVASVAVVLAYFWASGRARHVLQIDYAWTGDMIDSAEVYLDGTMIGVLEPYVGSQRQTGFEVEPGPHKVRVVHPRCPDGREYDVDVQGGLTVMIADIEDGYSCRVVLR